MGLKVGKVSVFWTCKTHNMVDALTFTNLMVKMHLCDFINPLWFLESLSLCARASQIFLHKILGSQLVLSPLNSQLLLSCTSRHNILSQTYCLL